LFNGHLRRLTRAIRRDHSQRDAVLLGVCAEYGSGLFAAADSLYADPQGDPASLAHARSCQTERLMAGEPWTHWAWLAGALQAPDPLNMVADRTVGRLPQPGR